MPEFEFQQPTSPLALVGQYAQTVNAINQNRLFPLIQQEHQLAVQQGQVDVAATQQKLAATRVAAAQAYIGSLGPTVTHDNAVSGLGMLGDLGVLRPQDVTTMLGSIPADPAKLRDWATSGPLGQLAALGPAGALAATQPPPIQVNRGGKIDLVQAPQIGPGGPTPVPSVVGEMNMTLTPEQKVSLVPTVAQSGPNAGQPMHVPTGALFNETGDLNQSSPYAPGGAIPAGLPPGSAESIAASRTASAAQYADFRATVGSPQFQDTTNSLRQIDTLLGQGKAQIGPGSEAVNTWRNFLRAQLPILDKLFPGTNERTIESADTDQLLKYMARLAGSQAVQYGPGSDARLANAAAGNVHATMSTLGAQDVNRVMLALQRAQIAEYKNFTGQPSDWGDYAANWNRTVDPRAFMLDVMPAKDRAKMLSTITTAADKRRLLAGKQAAEQAGIYAETDIPR